MLKKHLLKIGLAVLMISLYSGLSAQTNSNQVYKEWNKLGESKTMIDVFYRVVKCADVNQIHVMIFNENVMDQDAQFTLEFINPANDQKLTKEFNFPTTKAAIYKAECNSNTSLNALKIDLPTDFDPTKVNVKLTFKP